MTPGLRAATLIAGGGGMALAVLTPVSLLTGTGTVWVGVVIAVVAFVTLLWFDAKRTVTLTLVGLVFAVIALSAAIYDEHQLNVKRQQIEQIFGR